MQNLVSLRCVDVCMCFGLSVVGDQVQFDDEICGKLGHCLMVRQQQLKL